MYINNTIKSLNHTANGLWLRVTDTDDRLPANELAPSTSNKPEVYSLDYF